MADAVKLPTQEELASLPRTAMVAFALRCARQAQRITDASLDSSPDLAETVQRALATAKRLVVDPEGADVTEAGRVARECDTAADRYAALAEQADHANDFRTALAARVRSSVARAAARAASIAGSDRPAQAASEAAAAAADVLLADAAIMSSGKSPRQDVIAVIRQNFERLCDAIRREGWSDNSPISTLLDGD